LSRNAVAAKRRKQKLNPDDLAPGISSGITVGASVKEALAEHPIKPIRPLEERLGHMRDVPNVRGTRIPTPRFVAIPNDAIVNMGDGRKFKDVDRTMTLEQKRAIQSGHMCLRCGEPQPNPFPKQCDLCGYPMADRQIMDCALEFEGERHLGPRKPMSEYLDEQELRVEKRRFDAEIAAGKSRMRGLR
jgi:ribosomal protein L37E